MGGKASRLGFGIIGRSTPPYPSVHPPRRRFAAAKGFPQRMIRPARPSTGNPPSYRVAKAQQLTAIGSVDVLLTSLATPLWLQW